MVRPPWSKWGWHRPPLWGLGMAAAIAGGHSGVAGHPHSPRQPPPDYIGGGLSTLDSHQGWPATPGGHLEVAAPTTPMGGRPPTSLFQILFVFFLI
jgi:hypothetical protein